MIAVYDIVYVPTQWKLLSLVALTSAMRLCDRILVVLLLGSLRVRGNVSVNQSINPWMHYINRHLGCLYSCTSRSTRLFTVFCSYGILFVLWVASQRGGFQPSGSRHKVSLDNIICNYYYLLMAILFCSISSPWKLLWRLSRLSVQQISVRVYRVLIAHRLKINSMISAQ